MEMVLKDGTQIEILDGATLNSIIVLLEDYASLEELANKLSDDNLSEVLFKAGEKTKGTFAKMAIKTPNFYVTKLDSGKVQVVFGLRSKTQEELYKDAIQTSITYLSDEQALTVAELYPEWATGKSFEIGDRYRYGGVLYKCLQDHNGQADWAPEAAPSLWTKVLIPDTGTIAEWEQPESTNPYVAGDKVTHNGATWVSDVDNNIWEPGVYGWTVVAE